MYYIFRTKNFSLLQEPLKISPKAKQNYEQVGQNMSPQPFPDKTEKINKLQLRVLKNINNETITSNR